MKKVFIIDDSAPVRARLVEMLSDINGVDIVGEATTISSAVSGIVDTRPNYVVLDFQLEVGNGADVLNAVRTRFPDVVFIVITNHPQPQIRRLCMDAGADAFFDKNIEFGKVRDIIAGTSSN